MTPALRVLLPLAFALAVIVVVASATLRLAANGIGCTPWPACYGQEATAAAASEQPLLRGLRIAHRIAASAFALVALAVVALGWRRWRQASRVAGVALLGVTGMLAWVGLYTPSPLPGVTLLNVLGGFTLLALLAFLLAAARTQAVAREQQTPASPAWILLWVALVLQAGGGALISARLAGDACAAGCAVVWLPDAFVLLQPFVAGAATELLPRGGEPLHLLHRLGGLALVLVCVIVAAAMFERGRRWAGATLSVAAAAGALGFAIASTPPVLPLAVLHALAAGLLFAALAAMLAARNSREKPG